MPVNGLRPYRGSHPVEVLASIDDEEGTVMNDQLPPFDPAPNPGPTKPARRLTRSRTDKWMGGVAGGLAEYFGVDSTWVRVAFVVSIILPGPQVLLYLLLWLIIPQD